MNTEIKEVIEAYNRFEEYFYFGVACITPNELYRKFNEFLNSEFAPESLCFQGVKRPKIFRRGHSGDYLPPRIPEIFENSTPENVGSRVEIALKSQKNKAYDFLVRSYVELLKTYEFRPKSALSGDTQHINGNYKIDNEGGERVKVGYYFDLT